MTQPHAAPTGDDTRLVWVDPVVTVLDIADTAMLPTTGGDKGLSADCTKS